MTMFKETFELCSKFVQFFKFWFHFKFLSLLYKRIGMLFEEKNN